MDTVPKTRYANDITAIERQATRLKFELLFDRTSSLFGMVKDLAIDKDDFASKMAISIFGGDNIFYTRLDEGFFIEKRRFLDEDFPIKKSINEMVWELTNDKRKILGYECYKAIGNRHTMEKNFGKSSHNIVAWFCPDISFNYGPFEAVGLPGMVLQLDLKGHSIIISELDLGAKVEVDSPIKGKTVSQNEFDSIMKKIVKTRVLD